MAHRRLRVELHCKNVAELERIGDFLNATPQIASVNIPNKRKDDPLLEFTRVLKRRAPHIDVCPHFSIKQQYQRSETATLRRWAQFEQQMKGAGVNDVLIVSGGGAKRKLETIGLLQAMKPPTVSVGVAFNPYFPQQKDMQEEKRRLVSKLQTGRVQSVWLQFGSDLNKLQAGLSWLQGLPSVSAGNIRIVGSVFVPNSRFLSQMAFRPWSGVFLDAGFLSGVEAADKVVGQMLQLYSDYGVEPLIETAVRSPADLDRLEQLLAPVQINRKPPMPPAQASPSAGGSEHRHGQGQGQGMLDSWFDSVAQQPQPPQQHAAVPISSVVVDSSTANDLECEVSQIRRRCAEELASSMQMMGTDFSVAQCEVALRRNQDNNDRAATALLAGDIDVADAADADIEMETVASVQPHSSSSSTGGRTKKKKKQKKRGKSTSPPRVIVEEGSSNVDQLKTDHDFDLALALGDAAAAESESTGTAGAAVDASSPSSSSSSPSSAVKRQRQEQQELAEQQRQQRYEDDISMECADSTADAAADAAAHADANADAASVSVNVSAPPGLYGQCVLMWFRHDLRLADNPALIAAAAHAKRAGLAVVPVFVWSPEEEGRWGVRGAREVWLKESLRALDADLRQRYGEGCRLVVRRAGGGAGARAGAGAGAGAVRRERERERYAVRKYETAYGHEEEYAAGESDHSNQSDLTLDELRALVRETGAQALYFNKRYEPEWRTRDKRIAREIGKVPAAAAAGAGAKGQKRHGNGNGGGRSGRKGHGSGNGKGTVAVCVSDESATLLYEPERVTEEGFNRQNGWSGHWGTLMPFYKACKAIGNGEPSRPLPPPATLRSVGDGTGTGAGTRTSSWPASLSLDSEALGLAARPKKRRGHRKRKQRVDEHAHEHGHEGDGDDDEYVEDWGVGIRDAWQIGERAAQAKLAAFVGSTLTEEGLCDTSRMHEHGQGGGQGHGNGYGYGVMNGNGSGNGRGGKKSKKGQGKAQGKAQGQGQGQGQGLTVKGLLRFGKLGKYESSRSRAEPEQECVSRLSPHLQFGELSPRALHWAVKDAVTIGGLPREKTKTFGRRLYWRDLAYYQLWCFPQMATVPVRAHYSGQRWTDVSVEPGKSWLRAWKEGRTGYPMVDAGMRELWQTGYIMQNVRMVCAGFLTEYLNINWTHGVEWFHDTLVDADLAINAMMWQNAGRSGIDQWNFRTSPESGSQDPTGAYVREWVPELARAGLSAKEVHRPWTNDGWKQSRQRRRHAQMALADAADAADDGYGDGDAAYDGSSEWERARDREREEAERLRLALSGLSAYPDRIVSDLAGARAKMVEAMIDMRRDIAATDRNDAQGYDVIDLPVAPHRTRVFTKQEFRVSKSGALLATSSWARKGAAKPHDLRGAARGGGGGGGGTKGGGGGGGGSGGGRVGIIGGSKRGGKHAQVSRGRGGDDSSVGRGRQHAQVSRQSVMDEYMSRATRGGSSSSHLGSYGGDY